MPRPLTVIVALDNEFTGNVRAVTSQRRTEQAITRLESKSTRVMDELQWGQEPVGGVLAYRYGEVREVDPLDPTWTVKTVDTSSKSGTAWSNPTSQNYAYHG